MSLKRTVLLFLLSLASFSLLLAQPAKVPEPAKAPKAIRPEPALDGPVWDGSQFVRADQKGKVFLFRGNKFEVYSESEAGTLGEPRRLETTAEASVLVHDAVLSRAGDQWLVHADAGVRLFVDGKEKPLAPLRWRPWSVAFLRNTPVVAVLPSQVGPGSMVLESLSAVPWLLSLGGGRWENMVDHRRLTGKELVRQERDQNDFVADYAVFLHGDHEGKLWVGRQYAYRAERWSASGRSLVEVVVNGGKVEEKKLREPDKTGATKNYHSFRAKPAILDLVEGSDHRMYFLVAQPDGALALDRYDPTLAALERVSLDLKKSGRFTLAAGKMGLYLAAWNGRGGRWRMTWESLDQADWQEVEEAEVRAGSASGSAR